MPNIGQFKDTQDNAEIHADFQGSLHTRDGMFNIDLVRNEEKTDDGPDYIAYAPNGAPVGSGWERVGRESGNVYISLSIDDPAMSQKINVNLYEKENGVWDAVYSRTRGVNRGASRTQAGPESGMDAPPQDDIPDFSVPSNGQDRSQGL